MISKNIVLVSITLAISCLGDAYGATTTADQKKMARIVGLNPSDTSHFGWYNEAKREKQEGNRDWYVAKGYLPALGGGAARAPTPPPGSRFHPEVVRGMAGRDAVVSLVKQQLSRLRIPLKPYNVETGVKFQVTKHTYPETPEAFYAYRAEISSSFFKRCIAYIDALDNRSAIAANIAVDLNGLISEPLTGDGLDETGFSEVLEKVASLMSRSFARERPNVRHIRQTYQQASHFRDILTTCYRFVGTQHMWQISETAQNTVKEVWLDAMKKICRALLLTPSQETPFYPTERVITARTMPGDLDDRQKIVNDALVRLLNKAREDSQVNGTSDWEPLLKEINIRLSTPAEGAARRVVFQRMILGAPGSRAPRLFALLLCSLSKSRDLKEFSERERDYVLFNPGSITNSPDFISRGVSQQDALDIVKLVDTLTGHVRNPLPAAAAGAAAAAPAPENVRAGNQRNETADELARLRGGRNVREIGRTLNFGPPLNRNNNN